MTRRLAILISALVALAAGAFVFRPAPAPVSDPRLPVLRDSIRVLANALSHLRSQTLAELSLRQSLQADLARQALIARRATAHARAQTDSARRVLADSAATLQTLRVTLATQVTVADTLAAQLDRTLMLVDTLNLRLTRETRAAERERAASDSVRAAQSRLIDSLSTPEQCRILRRVACPTRTQAGLIGSLLAALFLLVT